MKPQLITITLCTILFIGASVASDVLELTEANFQTEVKKHDVILIEFFAPWCGHCKQLAPEYDSAAKILKSFDPPVPLAKVDCTAEQAVCTKYGVSGYPTLKIFKSGEYSKDYDGPRDSKGIVEKMQKQAGPISKELVSVEDSNNFISKDYIAVIGFFDDLNDNLAKSFMNVADQIADVRFAHTVSKDVKEFLKHSADSIVLYRPKILQSIFEDAEVICTETSIPKIVSFLKAEALGLCAERAMSNAENFGKPLFVAYFNIDYTKNPKGTKYWRNRVMKVGKKLRDEGESVNFGISSIIDRSSELDECGIQYGSVDKPVPVVCAWDSKNKKYKMTETFSMESFEQFVRDVLAGKIEPHLKSELVPESNDEPVKVVVAKNFEEIVNDETKDVLIEFYAPWCGHCKSLVPKYDELATKLKDEESIVIAKMDATANDVPGQYEVSGFPTIYFAPKGSKDSPKKYEGNREVEDFIKYLSKESTDGLKTVSEKKKKGKKIEL